YWRLEYLPKTSLPYEEALDRTRALVNEAVRLRLRSDVPLGVFLSGGVDSSVVAYEAAKQVGETLQTFTVSMGQDEFDEAPIAQRTAQALRVRNTVLPLKVSPLDELQFLARHYDQPFADSSAIPSYAVSRMAGERLKVVLNGDGGDELFAGYRRYLAANRFDHFRRLPRGLFRVAARGLAALSGKRRSRLGYATRFVRGMGSEPGARFLAWTTDMIFEPEKRRYWRRGPMRSTEQLIEECLPASLPMLDTQRTADMNFILGSTLLVKMDMATMAASLEARSPLLDSVLAEFTATLPGDYLLRNGRPKAMLRDAYRGRLPDEVIGGEKRGFEIPLVSWLRKELRPIIQDTVGSKDARVRAYLADELVDGLLGQTMLPDRNWGQLVYALLVLELWLREIP
ncbi:MAG TPA: asparagine synthase C-terminal domain-containing protein, partial [Candidatus Angelobacter sp.]|nr:asparagine synthase C-terminal domain-containing protein [Candidatus Angelobacter sp.]